MDKAKILEACRKLDLNKVKIGNNKPRKVPKYALPGRGRKYCPNCECYVGVRTEKCSCGHQFKFNKPKHTTPEPQDTIEQEGTRFVKSVGKYATDDIVLTPSDKCPVSLQGTSYEDVEEWCELLLSNGRTTGKIYAPSALRYFAREFYDVNSEEYREVMRCIRHWYHLKVGA